jgi:hypothetical protein
MRRRTPPDSTSHRSSRIRQAESPVWGGKTVNLETALVNGNQVIFEDLMPGANWAHPAVFRVVSNTGAVLEEVKTSFPPEGIEDAPQVWGNRVTPSRGPDFKIDDFGGKYHVANPEKFYAVLINGHADRRHWNDFSFLYRVLVKVYGYKRDNILVADSAFKDRLSDLDGEAKGKSEIQYGSTRQDIKTLMADVKAKLKAGDHLVLAINDHGGSIGGESTIVAYDGQMKVSEFAKLLKDIKAEKVLTMYEQCYSGGFVRPSVGYNRVSMSAATNSEYSWASMDLNFDEWIYYAIAAFGRQTYQGERITLDLTKDGKVSAKQAFAYSVSKDRRQESPLLESYNNSGMADRIGLDF